MPTIRTPHAPDEVRARLDAAARRGKLPGWQAATPRANPNSLFEITDFGRPYEYVLSAIADRHDSGTSLRFTMRPKPTLPIVYLVLLITTVWPGVWLTDSMIKSYFTNYHWHTWMWYLPLTVPFVPWGLWSAWKKSKTSAATEATELIETVAGLIDGSLERPATAPQPQRVGSPA